jgi:phage RecT family recombinase
MSEVGEPTTEVIVRTLNSPQMATVIRNSLPPAMPYEKFLATAVSAFKTTPPEVFDGCDRGSIYNAIARAARDGLLIDGRHGAIVPFRERQRDGRHITKAQFLIMPQGIIDAFARVGISAYATSVYEHDEIDFWDDGEGQHVRHKFNPFGERGQYRGAFACARSKDGRVWVEAMGIEELKRVQASSRAPDSPAWRNWKERMDQKSCLHRLAKRVPNVDVSDDEQDDRKVVQLSPPEPKLDRPKALEAVLKAATSGGASPAPTQEQPSPLPAEPPPGVANPEEHHGE